MPYLDQPRYVGYSFGYGDSSTSSVSAADDFVVFYNEWLTEFPDFLGRPLVIAGKRHLNQSNYIYPVQCDENAMSTVLAR